LDSHPDIDEKVRFAILNELSRKGMTKEELIASLGKPDLIDQEKEYEVFIYNDRKPQRYYLKNEILEKVK